MFFFIENFFYRQDSHNIENYYLERKRTQFNNFKNIKRKKNSLNTIFENYISLIKSFHASIKLIKILMLKRKLYSFNNG